MAMSGATGKGDRLKKPAVDAVASRLGLAAAPSFVLMAAFSALSSPGTMMCSAATAFAPINDMVLMYLLMSLFHLSPWMKLLSVRLQRPSLPVHQTIGD